MRCEYVRRIGARVLVAVAIAVGMPGLATAQFGGGGFGGGGFGGGGFGGGGLGGGLGGGGLGGGLGGGGLGGGLGGGTGGGTTGTGPFSGVVVNAKGVLQLQSFPDPTGQLTRQRFAAARAVLSQDVATRSPLRKVSLNRLEAACQRRVAEGRGPTEEMRYLAGLTRIEYVFYYPESRDVVIAGPAEPFGPDPSGRIRGMETGSPVLELQDLIVALRAFPPSGKATAAIYCSIDPTQEGLERMQQFLARIGSRATRADTPMIVNGLRESLGLQTITIGGVSPKTHFAQVLVEADYRMKLIGIGLETPPVKIKSYTARSNPAAVSRNALERWYFVPDYECVRVADDELAMQLVGEGVKLISENEMVKQDGSRSRSGRVNRASQAFVNEFTQKYPALARYLPVYAQLRNVIDMAVAAAFIQEQDYYGQAGWSLELFGSEQKCSVDAYNAPARVATAVNSLWKGRRLVTPVGGGVKIQAELAIDSANLLPDENGEVAAVRNGIDTKALADGQWWWD